MIDLQQLQIRPMRADDLLSIAQAFSDMNKTHAQDERYWRENVDGTRVTLVAVLRGTVVGYANVIWEPDYERFRQRGIPEINDMNSVTSLRTNGIGTRMTRAAEDLIRETGRHVVGIGVEVTRDHAIAQSLYPKLGHVSDGTGVHPDRWGGCRDSTRRLSTRGTEREGSGDSRELAPDTQRCRRTPWD